jgi:hypothetical protein
MMLDLYPQAILKDWPLRANLPSSANVKRVQQLKRMQIGQ